MCHLEANLSPYSPPQAPTGPTGPHGPYSPPTGTTVPLQSPHSPPEALQAPTGPYTSLKTTTAHTELSHQEKKTKTKQQHTCRTFDPPATLCATFLMGAVLHKHTAPFTHTLPNTHPLFTHTLPSTQRPSEFLRLSLRDIAQDRCVSASSGKSIFHDIYPESARGGASLSVANTPTASTGVTQIHQPPPHPTPTPTSTHNHTPNV